MAANAAPHFDMQKTYTNLTDAWNAKFTGPFTTRGKASIYILARKSTDNSGSPTKTVYHMSDSIDRLPSGKPVDSDLVNAAIVFYKHKPDVVKTDSRLDHLQKAVAEARADLRRYIQKYYPVGSQIAVSRGQTRMLLKVTHHSDNNLAGFCLKSGKTFQVSYDLITGRYKKREGRVTKMTRSTGYEINPDRDKPIKLANGRVQIVGFCGPSGAGKSSASYTLREHYMRTSFADPLRLMLTDIGFSVDDIYVHKDRIKEGCQATPRQIMNELGHLIRGRVGMRTLVNLWREKVNPPNPIIHPPLISVDDVRLGFEADAVHDLDGVVIKISRPQLLTSIDADEYEKGVNPQLIDATVSNSGTRQELEINLQHCLHELARKRGVNVADD